MAVSCFCWCNPSCGTFRFEDLLCVRKTSSGGETVFSRRQLTIRRIPDTMAVKAKEGLSVVEYIKSDLYRYMGRLSMGAFCIAWFKHQTFRHQVYMRMCNADWCIRYLGFVLYYISRILHSNLQISYKCKIGYGLYIGHVPVLVNSAVTIGNNVNLSQFTSIGTNTGRGATIGDNVYIGPGVCVVEDVVIGDYATIGAGSVVTKDIPAGATAAGNYAKVLNFNNPGRFIQNPWKIQRPASDEKAPESQGKAGIST